jgi:hypothetical protein
LLAGLRLAELVKLTLHLCAQLLQLRTAILGGLNVCLKHFFLHCHACKLLLHLAELVRF